MSAEEIKKLWLQIKNLAGDIAAATQETDKTQYHAALDVWKKAMAQTEEEEE